MRGGEEERVRPQRIVMKDSSVSESHKLGLCLY